MIDEAGLSRTLRALAEQSLEHAIILADPDGRIVWWSPGAARAFGYQSAEMAGLTRGDLLQRWTGVRPFKLQAGAATSLYWAIDTVRKGGIVSIVGVYGPTFNLVPIGNVVNKGITIRANQAAVKRHLPRLIEHIQATPDTVMAGPATALSAGVLN